VSLLGSLLDESVESAMRRERTAFDEIAAPHENRLVLFGAGGFGRRTLAGLRTVGIEPLAFVDNNQSLWGRKVDGLRVIPPTAAAAEFGETAVFVITVWSGQAKDCMADRVRQLRELGCVRVAPAGLLFWKYPKVFLPYYALDLPHKLLPRADAVYRAYEMFADEASRAEYTSQVAFRLHLDYGALARPGAEEHYFPPLFRIRADEFFVDCGAFDGDTIRALAGITGANFNRIVAFEPDPLNWPRLQLAVEGFPPEIRAKIECHPKALGAESGTIQFDSTGTDLAASGTGALSVDCVALDDALAGREPTMIKFDIEGAELLAIRGGKATIQRHHPLLAVSAYHRQSHLWEIPLAIAEIGREYRFALRPHSAEGWDLVCYAIPQERCL